MREMPIEFPTMARAMAIQQAANFWRTDPRTIRRWAEEAGDGLREAMVENGKHASRAAGKKQGPKNKHPKPTPLVEIALDDEAMRFLQRRMRWVCYSSRIHGATKDVYYHVGNRKLTFDGLISLAESYGFSSSRSG